MLPNRLLQILAAPDHRHLLWWLYGAVLAAAPGTALIHLSTAVQGAASVPAASWDRFLDPELAEGRILLSFACFILFILLYYRFSAGDYRYMWQRYAHLKGRQAPDQVSLAPKLSETHCCLDLAFLIGQAGLILMVANDLLRPERFFLLYEAVLSVNVCWLAFNYVRERYVRITQNGDSYRVELVFLKCHKAGARWAANNFLALLAFLLLEHLRAQDVLTSGSVLWASGGICFLNSVFDLAATHWLYFPGSTGNDSNPDVPASHGIALG